MVDRLITNLFLLTRSESLFRKLYRKYTPCLYRIALSLSNDKSVTEDIIQEVWIRAIEKLPQFKWQSSLKTWLSSIAINCCREYNRKRKFEVIEEITDNGGSYNNHGDSKMDVQKALVKLPEGYREVLLLHDMEGFKHNEIADLLGIDTGTSKSQLHHARKAIKNLLK